MCTMALLHRALAASQQAAAAPAAAAAAGQVVASAARAGGTSGTISGGGRSSGGSRGSAAAEDREGEEAAYRDHRMPRRLVAIAGVYDIGKHYEYEEGEPVCEAPHLPRTA
jgi:hypothetical protein